MDNTNPLYLKFYQFDFNLRQNRLKYFPIEQTIESEMRYVGVVNADVLIVRESNRKVLINNEYPTW